tara:strand:+ start:492 stop:1034 length:543 start_codon:yes stop_codon:yes gene_type:complete
MSEEDFFLKKMKGVIPIAKKNIIKKEIKKIPKTIKLTKKTIKNQPTKVLSNNKKTEYKTEPQTTNKKLRRGKINIDKKVDFHGNTLAEAEIIFNQTVIDSYNNSKRCILFITGKGLGINKKNEGEYYLKKPKLFYGKIRTSFFSWIKKDEVSKYILNVEQAKIEHGGDGAFYVYLRKRKN